MRTVNDVFAEAITSKTGAVEAAKARLSIIKKSKTMLKTVVQRILDVMGDEGYVAVETDAWDKKPRLYVSLTKLDSFKDSRLNRVLSLLDDYCPEQEVKEYAEYVNRDYKFKGDKFEAVVLAYVKSDSELCRRVVVGTETIQREKFELVCD
jgi:hypothetical protein